jgi:HK97 family phage prohead protease
MNLEASGIKLLREHDRTAPVGKAIEFSVNPGGVIGRFRVAKTSLGNDILVEAAEGLREGFSVGAKVLDYKYKGEVMHVTAAEIYEVSVVTHPAFGLAEASITEVAASESPEVETLEEKETPVTEEITPEVEVEAAEAPVVVAAAPVNTPIFTAPRVAPMDSAKYVEASIKAAMGDRDAAILVQAADDSTSNNTGLTLPTSLVSIERRKNARYTCTENLMAFLDLSIWKPHVEDVTAPPFYLHQKEVSGFLNVADVSFGGVCAVARFPSVNQTLKRGLMDDKAKLILPMQAPIDVSIEIRWAKRIKEHVAATAADNSFLRSYRFGLEFTGHTDQMRMSIRQFIQQLSQADAI